MRAPDPATLRIIDGCHGKTDAPMVKSPDSQLMAEEVEQHRML